MPTRSDIIHEKNLWQELPVIVVDILERLIIRLL